MNSDKINEFYASAKNDENDICYEKYFNEEKINMEKMGLFGIRLQHNARGHKHIIHLMI